MTPSSGSELRRRLRELERELTGIRAELRAAGPGEPLPGLHLILEVEGLLAALRASAVDEVVPRVAFSPLPGAPPHVLGSFVYRGAPQVAVDLAALIGRPREVPFDAHVLVLATSQPLAVVVDRVAGLVESPRVGALESGDVAGEGPWRAAALVEGICRDGDRLLPLLDVEALVRRASLSLPPGGGR